MRETRLAGHRRWGRRPADLLGNSVKNSLGRIGGDKRPVAMRLMSDAADKAQLFVDLKSALVEFD